MNIGIWIQVSHFPAGGPTSVVIGLMIGIKQLMPEATILINEPGYLNFQIWGRDRDLRMYPKNTIFGPNSLGLSHIVFPDPNDDLIWRYCKHITFSAQWIINWLEQKFPICKAVEEGSKTAHIWEAGIDTDFYRPSQEPKTQDFFIYYKSQKMADIEGVWSFIFHNYYGLKGSLICYHFYKPEMLREAAQRSRFCIMLDNEETQGLAALEILACNCPIFCIDRNYYTSNNKMMEGSVTSIVSWSPNCGMKSTREKWKEDFPIFLENLKTYTPAEFVKKSYTYKESAKRLLAISLQIKTLEQEKEQSLNQTSQ